LEAMAYKLLPSGRAASPASITPYPLLKTVCPSLTMATLIPGVPQSVNAFSKY